MLSCLLYVFLLANAAIVFVGMIICHCVEPFPLKFTLFMFLDFLCILFEAFIVGRTNEMKSPFYKINDRANSRNEIDDRINRNLAEITICNLLSRIVAGVFYILAGSNTCACLVFKAISTQNQQKLGYSQYSWIKFSLYAIGIYETVIYLCVVCLNPPKFLKENIFNPLCRKKISNEVKQSSNTATDDANESELI